MTEQGKTEEAGVFQEFSLKGEMKGIARNTVEEECVADADVMAHFDCIPSLFHLVYDELELSIKDGEEYVKKKLERDYYKLSERTRNIMKDRYDNIMKVLFVDK